MDFDFAIIGGGSAGYAAARTAAYLGLRTVVVEGGKEVAGLCILRGCMPSKTLLESANRADMIRNAEEFGLRVGNLEVRPAEVVARKRRLIGEFADYRREQLESGDFEFIRARGVLKPGGVIDLKHLDGSESSISAKTALISTGSVIREPNIPGLGACDAINSDDILEMEHLPKSVVVLGAGPVGLELAHYLRAMGVEVTIIQRSGQLLSWFDADLAEVVAEAYRSRGITIYTETALEGIDVHPDCKSVRFRWKGELKTVEAQEVFNGLGRRPNLDGLGLEEVGVEVVRGKVKIRPTMQSSVDWIFAAGDVCGPFEIVHIAIAQGEIAAKNAAKIIHGEVPQLEMDYRLALFGVFTEPQVAAVGMTEASAQASKTPYIAASYPFGDHGKSIVMGETHGSVKLLADPKSGEILGGACVGPHATDLIHEIVVAMAFHATAAQLAAIPHYHPTLSEIWSYPTEELASRVASQSA